MPNRKNPSSSENRRSRSRARHRAQRQEAELHDLEVRTQPPGTSRRKKRAPLWKRLRLIAFGLLLAGGVELVFAGLTSPKFDVADVTISGVEITSQEAVQQVRQSLIGHNWVRIQTDEAHQKIAALPTVKEARITRALHWPPFLHIHIEERAPFARVGAGENWWVVDETGVPFRRAEKKDENLYAITGPKLQPILGKSLTPTQWQDGARLVKALSTQKEKWPLRRIYLDKNGFASLRLQGGREDRMLIRLGGDRWEEKLQRAQWTLEYLRRTDQRAQSLNLVSYNMPQWTPLPPASDESTPQEESPSAGA